MTDLEHHWQRVRDIEARYRVGYSGQVSADQAEQEASFQLRWDADQRAIKRWQEAHPGNENVWPDHADLCVWLLEQLEGKDQVGDDPEQGEGQADPTEPITPFVLWYRLRCDRCGTTFTSPAGDSNKVVLCGGCGVMLKLPEINQTEPAGDGIHRLACPETLRALSDLANQLTGKTSETREQDRCRSCQATVPPCRRGLLCLNCERMERDAATKPPARCARDELAEIDMPPVLRVSVNKRAKQMEAAGIVIDWERVTATINESGHPRARQLGADKVRQLVLIYGWTVVTDLIEGAQAERVLREMVAAGMPFDEAAKVAQTVVR